MIIIDERCPQNTNTKRRTKAQHIDTIFIKLTLSCDVGKKLMPFGTSRAIRAALTFRTVCKNTCHVRSSSLWRHPYGQPRITVFGFMPPRPIV